MTIFYSDAELVKVIMKEVSKTDIKISPNRAAHTLIINYLNQITTIRKFHKLQPILSANKARDLKVLSRYIAMASSSQTSNLHKLILEEVKLLAVDQLL